MVKERTEYQPTSLAELAQMNQEVVPLPGWAEGVPFFARVRKISLYDMIQAGRIPNELLDIANKFALPREGHNPLLALENEGKLDDDGVERFHRFLDHVARHTLLEPSYEEVIEHAGCLTLEQKQALLLAAMVGVRALHSFRPGPGSSSEDSGDGESVGSETE